MAQYGSATISSTSALTDIENILYADAQDGGVPVGSYTDALVGGSPTSQPTEEVSGGDWRTVLNPLRIVSATMASSVSVTASGNITIVPFTGSATIAITSTVSASATLVIIPFTGSATIATTSTVSASATLVIIPFTGSGTIPSTSALTDIENILYADAQDGGVPGDTYTDALVGGSPTSQPTEEVSGGDWRTVLNPLRIGSATLSSTSSVSALQTIAFTGSGIVASASSVSASATLVIIPFTGSATIDTVSTVSASSTIETVIPVYITLQSVSSVISTGVNTYHISVSFVPESSVVVPNAYVTILDSLSVYATSNITSDNTIIFLNSINPEVVSNITCSPVIEKLCSVELYVYSGIEFEYYMEFVIPVEVAVNAGLRIRGRVNGGRYIIARLYPNGDFKLLGNLITTGDRVRFHRNGDLTVGSISTGAQVLSMEGSILHVNTIEEDLYMHFNNSDYRPRIFVFPTFTPYVSVESASSIAAVGSI